ncbi:replicative DNA helicase [Elizabethkingia meningoseptica]|uniref:replicative DNA helicase n=1 Tax=Elizabethkingia meningoseptica TaxID=238 RepID=UPI0023B1AB8C|nr:replicative DNA helicase [Elizabethkingia meningoseptica]MDE5530465.1 replicative DNA helicase [Elizabethkingia meningoseptica]MDE5534022.1 replicative DNA helicase [Elizabethkingia meningoseptica]MDE5542702.1 replicative DNA helicase [Elizabethkingia meningoseptica]
MKNSHESGLVPPNNVEFEKLVIGTMLIDNRAIDVVRKRLSNKSEAFYDPKHVIIYNAILELLDNDQPVDMMTVILQLKKTEKLLSAGGDEYIIEITLGISSSANLEFHVMVVLEKYIARKLIGVCQNTIIKLQQDSSDTFKDFDFLVDNMNEIEELIASQEDEKSSAELHFELIEQQKQKVIPGVASKFPAIQTKTNGWRNGTFNILAARPGMGKTAFALDDAFAAARRGEPVAFVSLEMGALELHQRMVSNELEIPYDALDKRNLNENQISMMYQTRTFDKLPFYIVDNTSDMNKIFAKIRLLKKEKGIKLVVIDYLQLIDISIKGANREQQISTISRKCKRLARELDIPIIALSQLSRAVEQRPGKRPQNSDLRESGALEQDADTVNFLFRPEYYKIEYWDREWEGQTELPTKGEVEFIRSKFRGGAPFEERLKFRGDYQKFVNIGTDFGAYSNPVPFGDVASAFGTNSDDDLEF